MPRPVVGIVYDPRTANAPYHILIDCLIKSGINTLMFDCDYDSEAHLDRLVQRNLPLIDGVLLPGAPVDIPSEFYGQERNSKWKYAEDHSLIKYQKKLIIAADKLGMPIWAICHGSEAMSIAFGGNIDQDITLIQSPVKVNHDIMPLEGDLAHHVTVLKDTYLHGILAGNDPEAREGDLTIMVNSWHHTANRDLPENFIVNAIASDGVFEGLEQKDPGNRNCLGIQFHPELLKKEKAPVEFKRQMRIIRAIEASCNAYRAKKSVHKALLQNFESIKMKLKKTQTAVNHSVAVVVEEETAELSGKKETNKFTH